MRREGVVGRLRAALAVAAMVALAGSAAARAAERELVLYAGAYDLSKRTRAEAGFELRWRAIDLGLVPVAGAAASEDGALWAYGGLQRPFPLGSGWRLTPGFAVSLYEAGDGLDLGGPIEFRSSLELARELARGRRLGVAVYHLSNASIYDDNPGSNSLVVTFALPLR